MRKLILIPLFTECIKVDGLQKFLIIVYWINRESMHTKSILIILMNYLLYLWRVKVYRTYFDNFYELFTVFIEEKC